MPDRKAALTESFAHFYGGVASISFIEKALGTQGYKKAVSEPELRFQTVKGRAKIAGASAAVSSESMLSFCGSMIGKPKFQHRKGNAQEGQRPQKVVQHFGFR